MITTTVLCIKERKKKEEDEIYINDMSALGTLK